MSSVPTLVQLKQTVFSTVPRDFPWDFPWKRDQKKSLPCNSAVIDRSVIFQVFVILPLWALKGKKRREEEHSLWELHGKWRSSQQCEGIFALQKVVLHSCTESAVASHHLVCYLPTWKMRSIPRNLLQLHLPPCGYHGCSCNHPRAVLWGGGRAGTAHSDGTTARAWDRHIGQCQQSCEAGKFRVRS